ncbi:MAG TPA: DGQHR domain-containing protein [Chthonomonadaceae bacterium]|nr:DGQHR domain-containing protein [Chthonomonadaceae bacterium]
MSAEERQRRIEEGAKLIYELRTGSDPNAPSWRKVSEETRRAIRNYIRENALGEQIETNQHIEQDITIQAIRVKQNDHELFMADLSADILLKRAKVKVDKWMHASAKNDPSNQGYQREELRTHYSKVGNYLVKNKKAILPTSVLLSVRGAVQFEPVQMEDKGNCMIGSLTIPASEPLWIVDGQHRIAGLRYAIEELGSEDARNFSLPAVIMAGMPKFDEVQQFFIVNSTSKRIKTDLAQRLLTEMAEQDEAVRTSVVAKGQSWLLRAVRIAEKLNEKTGSPWEGRIQRPNMRKIGKVMIVESSFNQSLKPILSISWMQKMPDEQVVEIIDRYWRAIMEYLPDALDNPRDYALQKTTGVYPWHMVAPVIFERCRSEKFSVERMVECLKPLQEDYLTAEFWASGTGTATQYSSRAGFTVLAHQMMEHLPELESEFLL